MKSRLQVVGVLFDLALFLLLYLKAMDNFLNYSVYKIKAEGTLQRQLRV